MTVVAPTIVGISHTHVTSDATSTVVALPNGSNVVGRMLIFIASKDGAGAFTLPAGWNAGKYSLGGLSLPGGADALHQSFWHLIDGTEGYPATGATETFTHASERTQVTAILVSGQNIDIFPQYVQSGGSSGNADPAAITLPWAAEPTLFITGVTFGNGGDVVTAYPTTYTDNRHSDNTGGAAAGIAHAICTKVATSSSDNPVAFANTSTQWFATTIAIRGAAPADEFQMDPDADDTGGWAITGAATRWEAVDDFVGTGQPDGFATYIQAGSKINNDIQWLSLSNTPGGFNPGFSFKVEFDRAWGTYVTGQVGSRDTVQMALQIFKSDKTTALTTEVICTEFVPFNTFNDITFTTQVTGLPGFTKADWDGARIRIRQIYAAVGGADAARGIRPGALAIRVRPSPIISGTVALTETVATTLAGERLVIGQVNTVAETAAITAAGVHDALGVVTLAEVVSTALTGYVDVFGVVSLTETADVLIDGGVVGILGALSLTETVAIALAGEVDVYGQVQLGLNSSITVVGKRQLPPPPTSLRQSLLVEIAFDSDPSIIYSDAVLNDGAVGYWRLGESSGVTAFDETGVNDGTYTNTPTLGEPGFLPGDPDTAVTFDAGSSEGVTVVDSVSLSPTNEVTIETMFRTSAWPAADRFIVGKAASYTMILRSDGKVEFKINTGGGAGTIVGNTPLALDTDYHIVCSYNMVDQKIYLNGELDQTGPYSTAINDNANSLYFATDNSTYLSCTMDEVAIYPVGLTQHQVDAHYRARDTNINIVWTDISDDVIQVTTNRGRQYELDRIETGTATITLDNVSRAYDPTNSASVHYPNVLPMRRVRVRAVNSVLQNGDFETNLNGWAAYSGTTIAQDLTSNTGEFSAQIDTPGAASGREGMYTELITVDADSLALVTVWALVDIGDEISVSLDEYDVTESYTGSTISNLMGTGNWEKVTVSKVMDSTTFKAGIAIFSADDSVPITFNVDTIDFSKTYPIYRGFIERWPLQWEGHSYGSLDIQAVDGYVSISKEGISGTVPQGLTGSQIDKLLDLGQWPRNLRRIDPGLATAAEITLTEAQDNALQQIQEVAATELGEVFVGPDGFFVFKDRSYRTDPPLLSFATFSDLDGQGLEYQDLLPSFDVDRVRNEWQITPDPSTAGVVQIVTDEASIRKYFRQKDQRTTRLTSEALALEQATYLLLKTATPRLRFDTIRLEPMGSLDIWEQALGRGIGDRITVLRHPPGGGDIIAYDVFIESIHWDILVNTPWAVTWSLSPGDLATTWTLNDATLGQLSTNNTLAY